MKRSFATAAWFAAAFGAAILQPSIIGSASAHDAETVKQIFAKHLPNVPGNSMTAFVVEYAPGGKGEAHHHSGSVFAYVLEGEIRSQISDGEPAKVYKAGEFFFEPPGSEPSGQRECQRNQARKLLAVFVAADDAMLTAPGGEVEASALVRFPLESPLLDRMSCDGEATWRRREKARILSGGCLCGAVQYKVRDEFRYAMNCHCSQCRRATGSAFKPFGGIERDKFAIAKGANRSRHQRRGRQSRRLLQKLRLAALFGGARRRLRACTFGTLADGPTIRPTAHIYVGSKAPWFTITDDLPQHEEL